MLKVYTASKMKHAPKWLELHRNNKHIYCHARWLKHTQIGTEDSADNAGEFWLQDEEDVKNADVLLLYAEEGEHLRGALVEAGIAIGHGIPVIVVGKHHDYGTWQHHPGVYIVKDLHDALVEIQFMEPSYYRTRRATK